MRLRVLLEDNVICNEMGIRCDQRNQCKVDCLFKNEYLSRLIIVRKIYVNKMVLGDGLIRGVI